MQYKMIRLGTGVIAGVLLLGLVTAGRAYEYGQWSEMRPFIGSSGDQITYYLFSPRVETSEPIPLVVWFHGGLKSNGKGGPNLPQDAFYKDEHQQKYPCYILRPVAIRGQNWVSPRGAGTGIHPMPDEPSPSMNVVLELIEKTVQEHPVDRARLYLLGASMGGYGVWDVICRYPDLFAAAMPICGGGDPEQAKRIKHLPIWITHGEKDPHVPVEASRAMFDALIKVNSVPPVVRDEPTRMLKTSPDDRIRYYEYKEGNHNAGWDRGMSEPDLTEWFFGHRTTVK
jgi:predicted peptidase